MKIKALIDKSAELLNIVLKSPAPADRNATEFFREKRAIGSKERKFISELVFFTLRNKISIENAANALSGFVDSVDDMAKTNKLISLQLLLISASFLSIFSILSTSFPAAELYAKIDKEDDLLKALHDYAYNVFGLTEEDLNNWIQEAAAERRKFELSVAGNDATDLPLALERLYSWPRELYDMLGQRCSPVRIARIAEFFTRPARVSIRINLSKTSRERVALELASEGFETAFSNFSPAGLIALRRGQISQSSPFLAGKIEIQEEGSQLISFALAPNARESVLDACCGAGGKSLHIADLQNDSGYITANDIEPVKLRRLTQRAARSGFTSIETHLTKRGSAGPNFSGKRTLFDKILVDAPCSGSGTLRREPMRKYRITRKLVEKLAEAQLEILTNYSRFLAVGGSLVYATCSIFTRENREVVTRFLENNPSFEPEPITPALSAYGIELPGLKENDFDYAVDPVELESDGFYFAKIKRISR